MNRADFAAQANLIVATAREVSRQLVPSIVEGVTAAVGTAFGDRRDVDIAKTVACAVETAMQRLSVHTTLKQNVDFPPWPAWPEPPAAKVDVDVPMEAVAAAIADLGRVVSSLPVPAVTASLDAGPIVEAFAAAAEAPADPALVQALAAVAESVRDLVFEVGKARKKVVVHKRDEDGRIIESVMTETSA